MRLLVHWLLLALSLLAVAYIVPGIELAGFSSALLAALVFGLINSTIGLFLKIATFPLTILTLGIFWFVINALMLNLASALVPGFRVASFLSAFLGAVLLSAVNLLLKSLVLSRGA